MNNTPESNVRTLLKGLSDQDFLRIGVNEVAYMRPLSTFDDEDQSFAVYAADGTKLGVLESRDRALKAMRDSDLMPVTLQ